MNCVLCNIVLTELYHSIRGNCLHFYCNECFSVTINHENCNHFKCPVCLIPIEFNEILSEPNSIREYQNVDQNNDLIYDSISIFLFPVNNTSINELSIEEKYLIYQLYNWYTILININEELIRNDVTYVIINKRNCYSNNILIGKIDSISGHDYYMYNAKYINRISGHIYDCNHNSSILKRISLISNENFIYKCKYKD